MQCFVPFVTVQNAVSIIRDVLVIYNDGLSLGTIWFVICGRILPSLICRYRGRLRISLDVPNENFALMAGAIPPGPGCAACRGEASSITAEGNSVRVIRVIIKLTEQFSRRGVPIAQSGVFPGLRNECPIMTVGNVRDSCSVCFAF